MICPESTIPAHFCARLGTSLQARHPSQGPTSSSRLGKCSLPGDAWQHNTLLPAGNSYPSSIEQSEQGPIDEGSRRTLQHELHVGAGRSFTDRRLSDDHVIVRKKILRQLMADLAQGLADIAQLRREAVTARAPPAPCSQPLLLGSQQAGPSPTHPRTPDTDLPPQCRGQRLQPQDMQTSRPPLRPDHGDASRRIDRFKQQHRKEGGGVEALKSLPLPKVPQRGESPPRYSYVQPTGHSIVMWQSGLRSGRPPGSRRASRPMPHAHDMGRHKSSPDACSAGVLISKTSEKRGDTDAHTSHEDGTAAAQQSQPLSKGAEDHSSERLQCGQQPRTDMLHLTESQESLQASPESRTAQAAQLPGDKEHGTPTLSPSQCQHLRQRYLPVYSMFDRRGHLACDVGGQQCFAQWEACNEPHLMPDAPDILGGPSRHDHSQDLHGRRLHDSIPESNPMQSQQTDADSASPGAQSTQHHSTEEDNLRAVLQAFTMRVS